MVLDVPPNRKSSAQRSALNLTVAQQAGWASSGGHGFGTTGDYHRHGPASGASASRGVGLGRSTMRRLLSVLAIVLVLVGCSSPGTAPTDGPAAGSSAPSAPSAPSGSSAPGDTAAPPSPASSEAGGNTSVLPGACEAGFAKYLTEIESIVSAFDPATATLGDLSTADQAVQEKSYELLSANNSTAPYSCSEVGLEFAYFDSNTPWDAVMAVASTAAPGTVAYLTAVRDLAAIDVAKVTDYGVEGCDAAVASIKKRIAAELSAGAEGGEEMGLKEGLALLGLYKAYMADVRNEVCPRDELGNDEFGFFGSLG